MIINILLVAVGGFFGSITRFLIADSLKRHVVGTFAVNVTGSFLLAVIFHYYTQNAISDGLWLLLGVGFCGAYTTFSAFGLETVTYLLEKRYKAALQYVLATFSISIILIAVILLER